MQHLNYAVRTINGPKWPLVVYFKLNLALTPHYIQTGPIRMTRLEPHGKVIIATKFQQ